MAWRVVGAAAIGRAHIDSGTLCQDAFAHRGDGEVLVAAVCDGAGSATLGGTGARRIADGVVDALWRQLERHGMPCEAASRQAMAADAVRKARGALEAEVAAGGGKLGDYACTLVAVVASSSGGWFVHVGDGVGVREAPGAGGTVLSLPENGEYANETWFVTMPGWEARLRITPFEGASTLLALMSDGTQAFAMARDGGGLFQPFITPVMRFLHGVDEARGVEALKATLADPRTDAITTDDKTLLLAWPAPAGGG
ncbi:PP2C family serine/threonine-protein phosphatase [Luteimonas sp. A537]